MTDLRYVVLRHEGWGRDHFDLMFETSPGSALATWQSPSWPPDGKNGLTRLADHRKEYLDYEGPVSGNRGTVRLVARGTCNIDNADADRWIIQFSPFILTLSRQADGDWSAMIAQRG